MNLERKLRAFFGYCKCEFGIVFIACIFLLDFSGLLMVPFWVILFNASKEKNAH
jgi:hypothetical protein